MTRNNVIILIFHSTPSGSNLFGIKIEFTALAQENVLRRQQTEAFID